jgi:hypothetical protein
MGQAGIFSLQFTGVPFILKLSSRSMGIIPIRLFKETFCESPGTA